MPCVIAILAGSLIVQCDKDASRESGLLADLTCKDEKVGFRQWTGLPLRFQQIDVPVQFEGAIDLFTDDTKVLAGMKFKQYAKGNFIQNIGEGLFTHPVGGDEPLL